MVRSFPTDRNGAKPREADMVTIAAGAPPRRRLRVLVVDDNQDAADSLAALAGIWGDEVRAVYDGPAALAAAQSFAPDCLFLDIGMPRMDGYAVARQVRQMPALRSA